MFVWLIRPLIVTVGAGPGGIIQQTFSGMQAFMVA